MKPHGVGIVVCGVGGRMGRVLVRLIHESPDVRLMGALDRPGSERVGRDAGEIAGVGEIGVPVISDAQALPDGRCVVVDFTLPAVTVAIMKTLAKAGIPIVVGTTGFSASQLARIRKLGEKIPTVLAPNTSVGINVLTGLVEQVAGMLGDAYDVEIVEAHHRFKRDAPSGTALALGQAAAKALNRNLNRVAVSGRKGQAPRKMTEIGMHSVRAGDIAGEHTVFFGGIGERIELTHRAHSRDAFGQGAIHAAQWLAGQQNGVYTMRDVLGLGTNG